VPMRSAEFLFGTFTLVPALPQLLEDGVPVRVGSRALAILLLLVERAPQLISHDEILAQVWPDTFIDQINLRVHLNGLRKILREGPDTRYIVNIRGQGYRFTAPITRRQAPVEDHSMPSNVPHGLIKLIGRAAEVEAITAALSARRFVTIVGPGGVGKTSVALEVAHNLVGAYRDGACMVDLTNISEPAVNTALFTALQLPQTTDLTDLRRHLRDRHVLFVLDNCEQLVEAAASLAENLLRYGANITVLVTSREPLRAEGEWVFRLSGLETPPPTENIDAAHARAFPAIELFVERAESGSEPFTFTDAEAPLLAEVCRRLDGIPLAIELAAARVGLFGITGLAAPLGEAFALLTRSRRTAPSRHKTLRATLDWSFNLLSTSEQTLLTRLSVFHSHFTREAAVAVAACNTMSTFHVLNGLTELIAKSLAVASLHESTVVFRLLETTRMYAAGKFTEKVEQDEILRRHTEYSLQVNSANRLPYISNF
jgi:predicted ATPase/DNA-binding winged helix-turn-helix (wHTH) protein